MKYLLLAFFLTVAKMSAGCYDQCIYRNKLYSEAKVKTISSWCKDCLLILEPQNQDSITSVKAYPMTINSSLYLPTKIEVRDLFSASLRAQCLVHLQPGPSAINAGVKSAKWLNNGSILLTTYDEFDRGYRNLSLPSVDVQTCSYTTWELGKMPKYYEIFVNEQGNFAVYRSVHSACYAVGCKIDYPLMNKTLYPHKMNAPWQDMYIELVTTADRNVSVQNHFNRFNDLSIVWLDFTNHESETIRHGENMKDMLYLKDARNSDIAYDLLSFCWIDKPSEAQHVTCSRFRENGDLDFTKIIYYATPISLVHVKHTGNEILLVARVYQYPKLQVEDCDDIFVSVVGRSKKPTLRVYREPSLYKCLGDDAALVASDTKKVGDGMFTSTFVCKQDAKLTVHQLSSIYNVI